MDIRDARPVFDNDEVSPPGQLTLSDRQIGLQASGIPPEPLVVYTDGGPEIIVGKEVLDLDVDIQTTRTYWIQNEIR